MPSISGSGLVSAVAIGEIRFISTSKTTKPPMGGGFPSLIPRAEKDHGRRRQRRDHHLVKCGKHRQINGDHWRQQQIAGRIDQISARCPIKPRKQQCDDQRPEQQGHDWQSPYLLFCGAAAVQPDAREGRCIPRTPKPSCRKPGRT